MNKKKKPMTPQNVFMPPEMRLSLKELAKTRGTTVGEEVRRAVGWRLEIADAAIAATTDADRAAVVKVIIDAKSVIAVRDDVAADRIVVIANGAAATKAAWIANRDARSSS